MIFPVVCANILLGTNENEPWKEALPTLLRRDVATKRVVLIIFTVETVGKDVNPSRSPEVGDVVDLTRLDRDGLGVETD